MLVDVHILVSMAMEHAIIKPLIVYIEETNITKVCAIVNSQSFVLQMSSLMDCFQLMLVLVLPLLKVHWIEKSPTHSPLM